MINVSYEVGGRKVSLGQFSSEIEKAVLTQVTDNVTKALSSVRCQEHGQYPSVVVKGASLDELQFEIHGCCEDLIARATQQLR